MKIRFYHNQIIPSMKCRKCDASRKARIFRDNFQWMARLECGHEKSLGYVKPPKQLEAEGFINSPNSL